MKIEYRVIDEPAPRFEWGDLLPGDVFKFSEAGSLTYCGGGMATSSNHQTPFAPVGFLLGTPLTITHRNGQPFTPPAPEWEVRMPKAGEYFYHAGVCQKEVDATYIVLNEAYCLNSLPPIEYDILTPCGHHDEGDTHVIEFRRLRKGERV